MIDIPRGKYLADGRTFDFPFRFDAPSYDTPDIKNAAVTVQKPVNVPGELLAVDGATLFTRDYAWSLTSAASRVSLADCRSVVTSSTPMR